MRATLQVQVRETDGTSALLSLSGELDLASSTALTATLDSLLTAQRPRLRHLVLDVAGVSMADVAGLSPVLHARAVLARRKGSVRLRNPSRLLVNLVDLLGLHGDLIEQPGTA